MTADVAELGATSKAKLQYIVTAHPDDDMASWSLVERSTHNYPLFIVLNQGEETGYCVEGSSSDNYGIHSAHLTRNTLVALRGRIVLHFLPPYCLDANRIERVWQNFHANVTSNHRCKTINHLLANARRYLESYRWRRSATASAARRAA